MNGRVLVVDDEEYIRDIVKVFLEAEGIEVYEAENGREALQIVNDKNIDLIILDVLLEDMNGFDICKKLRKNHDTPVFFISALSDDDYFLLGYKVGADDYISKPFKGTILAAKVRRILERLSNKEDKENLIESNCIVFNERSHECFVEDNNVKLTPKEFNLLLELVKNEGRVLTREYLIKEIWGFDFIGETRVVDNHIKKIRKKLGKKSNMIKTIFALGYKFEDE